MPRFYKRFSVIAGFAILLAFLIANTIVTRRQLAVQTDRATWIVHTHEVMSELDQLESLLLQAETGQRGYLYTGDPKYLTPYIQSISLIDPHLDALAHMTADNPHQQTLISSLRSGTHAKLDDLAQTLRLYRTGQPAEARASVASDTGLVAMNNFLSIVSQMNQEEYALMQSRTAAYKDSVRQTIDNIYLSSIIACIGLILLAYFLLHEGALRERHALDLHAREEWYRVTLTSIGDAVIATDQLGIVTFMNPVAERLIGVPRDSARGKNILDVFPIFNELTRLPAENPVAKVMKLGAVVEMANHTVLESTDGTLIPIEDSAAPIRDDKNRLLGVVLVFRDVTKEHQTQEVMRRTEKLAAAARLSATVAHEINNPLEAVVNLLYIAKTSANASTQIVQQLTLAEQQLERIAHVTRQTLGFYRESNEPEWMNLSEVVESVLHLYSNKLIKKDIAVKRDFGERSAVFGVRGELQQVVSNLISNAADAVGYDGTITISLHCNEHEDKSMMQMVVEDNGPGIPTPHLERVFEPFFTTKKDVGTGLGLWITKQIVERHGGTVYAGPGKVGSGDAASANGGGAAVTVLLPVCRSGEEPSAEAAQTALLEAALKPQH